MSEDNKYVKISLVNNRTGKRQETIILTENAFGETPIGEIFHRLMEKRCEKREDAFKKLDHATFKMYLVEDGIEGYELYKPQ